jgi:hypothetical protein
MDGLTRAVKVRTWGDESFEEHSPSLEWGPHVRVSEIAVPRHVLRFVPEDLRGQPWCCLRITGDALDLLKLEVRGDSQEWSGKSLDDFLRAQLFDEEAWVAVFEWQCDMIDEIMESDVNEFIGMLRANFMGTGERPKGFVAFHRATPPAPKTPQGPYR